MFDIGLTPLVLKRGDDSDNLAPCFAFGDNEQPLDQLLLQMAQRQHALLGKREKVARRPQRKYFLGTWYDFCSVQPARADGSSGGQTGFGGATREFLLQKGISCESSL